MLAICPYFLTRPFCEECRLGVEGSVVGQLSPRLRVAIVPRHLPAAGRVEISVELRGVVVLASSSVAMAHRDGLPSTRVEPAALAQPEKNHRSGKPHFGQN